MPWVNEEDAQKKGLSTVEYAAQQAEFWKKGLADWGQDGARIKRLKEAAEFRIYTPGSNAGIQVSILKSFAAPPPRTASRHRVDARACQHHGHEFARLTGYRADPIKSREHILISNILNNAWMAGKESRYR